MKKILSGLLIAAMLLTAAAGCSETKSAEETGGAEASADAGGVTNIQPEEETETEETVHLPDLPQDLAFAGHAFTILNNDYSIPVWSQIDIGAEELNGVQINDAVFNRNTTISERYDCTIVSMKSMDVNGDIGRFVKSGDSTVDMATVHLRTFGVHAQSGYFVELNTVDSMNLSEPWYDQNSVSDLSVNHRLYGAATDITLMDEQATTAMVFNKALYEDYRLADTWGDVYDVVRDEKWDYDTLSGMISSVSEDLDGDGNRTEKDRWGMLFQRDTLTSFLNGFGIRVMTKNGEDIPELTLMTDEGVVVLDRIFDLLYQPENCLNVMKYFGDATWSDDMVTTFEANNALLMWIRMADVENLRIMDVDFGILPIPKYTAEQNDYICAVNPYVGTVTCILQTNYDPHMTGYFIEAMAAESRYTLLPAYYDVNLKGKISRDVESQDMLDIIFTHRAYDLGQTYDPGNFSNTLIYMTMNEDRDFASKWASSQKMINKSLEKILKNFQ